MIDNGDAAPHFMLPSSRGSMVGLDDYLQRKTLVLYFDPKVETLAGITQACAFRDEYQAFVDAGAEVVGVSARPVEAQQKFSEEHQLPFPLLTDSDNRLRDAFGVKSALGIFPGRSTYVIDRGGTVQRVFSSQFRPIKHLDEALDVVQRLAAEASADGAPLGHADEGIQAHRQLESYVAPRVVEQLQRNSSGRMPTIHHFEGAILFVDAAGFTALAESLAAQGPAGADKLTHLLNQNLGRVVDIIRADGGQAIKFAGDAVIALWSAESVSLQEATLLAARCALRIQSTFGKASQSQGDLLSFKTMVGAGDLVEFHVGGALARWEHLISGDPLAQVGRIGHHAEVGRSLASKEAMEVMGAQGRFAPHPLGGFYILDIDPATTESSIVSTPPPGHSAADSELWAYIPGAIRAHLAAGQADWLGELRRVTILFIGLLDFDDGADDALDTLQRTMAAIQLELYGQEGSLNKLLADDKGLSAVAALGLPPLAHEDDALRGVRAAMGIQQRLQRQGMRCAIGVTTGRAFCGPVGSKVRREYTTIGDVVNTAARLMSNAGEGVLCDSATRRACRGRIEFDEFAPIALKGKAEAIPAFCPVGEATLGSDTFVVGRTAQSDVLLAKLDQLLLMESSVVSLVGPQGVGKTALATQLIRQAESKGVAYFRGRGDSIQRNTPYHAWRRIVAGVLDLPPHLKADALIEHIENALQDSEELLRLAPLLGAILALEWPDNPTTAAFDPEMRADHTQDLLVKLLQRYSQQRPLMLLFADAQWMDSSSWKLARVVERHLSPLLLIVGFRTEGGDDTEEYERMVEVTRCQELAIEGLSSDEVAELASKKLEVQSVPDLVRDTLLERAGGNPFYTHELVAAMREEGLLHIENGQCTVAPGVDHDEISRRLPESFQAVITSRVDRLSPAAQLTLKSASVLGVTFSRELLAAVHPGHADQNELDAHLQELQDHELVRRAGQDQEHDSGTDVRFRFRSELARDVVYGVMLFGQRQAIHRDIAAWYLDHSGEHSGQRLLIAYHWEEAGEVDKALLCLEEAGSQALSSYASREAISSFEHAVALAQKAWPARKSAEQRLRLGRWHRGIGESFFNRGRLDVSRQHYERALAHLGWPVPERLLGLSGVLASDVGRQMLHLVAPFLVSKAQGGAPQRRRHQAMLEATRCHLRLTEIYYFQEDKARVLHASVQGLNFGERLGISTELAQAYANLSLVVATVPAMPLARRYARRAKEVARSHGGRWTEGYVLSYTAIVWVGSATWTLAREALYAALHIGQELGDWRRAGTAQTILSSCYYFQGHFRKAAKHAEDVLPLAKGRDDDQQRSWASILLAEAQYRQGRLDAARVSLDQCQEFLKKSPESATLTIALGLRASLDWNEGRHGAAEEGALAALERLRVTPPTAYYVTEGFSGAAEVFVMLWQKLESEGSAVDTDVKARAKESCKLMRGYARVFRLALARSTTWTGVLQALEGQRKKARRTLRKAMAIAHELDMEFDAGLATLELARLTEGNERWLLLERALEHFQTAEAQTYVGRAETLLLARPGLLGPGDSAP